MAEQDEKRDEQTADDQAAAEVSGEEPTNDEPAAEEDAAEKNVGDKDASQGVEAEAPTAAEEDASREGAGVVAAQATAAKDVPEVEEGRNMRKERVGTVVSAKMEKTIVVSIERSKKHPMYKKYLTRSARKMTHDEDNEAGEGDTVRIMETRPISKTKRWRLVEILERAA